MGTLLTEVVTDLW